jgi:hypothetical protein
MTASLSALIHTIASPLEAQDIQRSHLRFAIKLNLAYHTQQCAAATTCSSPAVGVWSRVQSLQAYPHRRRVVVILSDEQHVSVQMMPGMSRFMMEVSVGDSYAYTSTQSVWFAPFSKSVTDPLHWNETVALWPAGPSNAAGNLLYSQRYQSASGEAVAEAVEMPTTSPIPGSTNTSRRRGPRNGAPSARSVVFSCLFTGLALRSTWLSSAFCMWPHIGSALCCMMLR